MIITKTPFRISLFGGGTDYPEWFCKNKGQVISFSINKYCYLSTRYLPPYFDYNYRIRFFNEQQTKSINQIKNPIVKETLKFLKFEKNKIEIVHHADLPGMSGLGASSSFAVGIFNALSLLKKKKLTKKQLADKAIYIERKLIGDKVGYQDQIAASYGGFNKIKFYKDSNYKVSNIKLNLNKIYQIENNLFVVYTGLQRYSKKITKNLSINTNLNKNDLVLNEISKVTDEAIYLFRQKKLDLKILSELLNYQWLQKKQMAKDITNSRIDSTFDFGIKNGALGGKLLGAGGGGFILFIVPDKGIKKFKKAFSKNVYMNIKIDNIGSTVVHNSIED